MTSYNECLEFAKSILKNTGISFFTLSESNNLMQTTSEFMLPHFLIYGEAQRKQILNQIFSFLSENTIYFISKELNCNFYAFYLPDYPERTIAAIGPFLDSEVSDNAIYSLMDKNRLPSEFFSNLRQYYDHVPLVPNSSILLAVLTTLGEAIWGKGNFSFAELLNRKLPIPSEDFIHTEPDQGEDPLWKMDDVFQRYSEENNFLAAVTNGDFQSAMMHFSAWISMYRTEKRASDPLRNRKNYMIVVNTLLRKAVERGKVHPIYIDRLSSNIAFKLEKAQSISELEDLLTESIRKYCLLVKNHSMQNYSDLIQRTLTLINNDLSALLTLSTIASMLHINASYLSSQFKKELGKTLTEYVTEKRINHAIFLLNSSNMQISHIAEQCGIPDIQYFTKTFKKRIGMSPSEYRKMVSS